VLYGYETADSIQRFNELNIMPIYATNLINWGKEKDSIFKTNKYNKATTITVYEFSASIDV
jgi:hypothetical protein